MQSYLGVLHTYMTLPSPKKKLNVKHSMTRSVRVIKINEDLLAAECSLQWCLCVEFEDVTRSVRLTATFSDRALVEKLLGTFRVSIADEINLLAILECLAICCAKSERCNISINLAVCGRKRNLSSRGSCDPTGEVLRDFRKEMLTVDGITVPDNTASSVGTCIQRFDAKSLSSSVLHHREEENDLTYHASKSGS